MRVLAFADLHIKYRYQHAKGDDRLKCCLNILNIMFDAANKANVRHILFCGDLFDQMQQLETQVINQTFQTFKTLFSKYPDIIFIAISGNHDYATKHTLDKKAVTALTFLSLGFEGRFILIDDAKIEFDDAVYYGVPYYEYPPEYYRAIDTIVTHPTKANILLTHATVIGYPEIPGYIDTEYVGFDKFDYILSGDIHITRLFGGRFLMLGNPLHKDRGDIGKKKGYYDIEINGKDITPEFIDITNKSIRFIRVFDKDQIKNDGDIYILFEDTVEELEVDTENLVTDFNSSIAPTTMLSSYMRHIGNDDPQLLQVGLDILNKV